MFDIVSSAAAEPSLPSGIEHVVPGLGPFPILQVFGGIAVLALGILMYIRGERAGQRKNEEKPDSEVHMHFDGPMVEALKCLKDIAESAKQIPEAAKMLIAVREDMIKRIEDTRHASRGELQREVAESERKLEDIQTQVREIAQSLAHIEGRLSAHRPTRDR